MSKLIKRNVVRLLLFGIPFALSYWVSKPLPQVAQGQTFVVCAYASDRPGELRIALALAGCPEGNSPDAGEGRAPVSVFPAVTAPNVKSHTRAESIHIPF